MPLGVAITRFCYGTHGRGEQKAALIQHAGTVSSVAFSPNGETLASASHDNTIQLWDLRTNEPLQTLWGHGDSVYCVAYAPNGERLASGAADGTIRLWDASTGESLKTIVLQDARIETIAFSPDGHVPCIWWK